MPNNISNKEWDTIYESIERMQRGSEFVQGKVIKRDPVKNLIWIDNMGDIAIPIFAFDYIVKYYDKYINPDYIFGSAGAPKYVTEAKEAIVSVICPQLGDTVLVVKHYGSRILPKCIGVLKSSGY